jgi:hypothetical protein
MTQLFPKFANRLAKFSIIGAVITVVSVFVVAALVDRSPFYTRVGEAISQPVPFSHKHHVGALGIDCRYCHSSVEKSSFAGIPPTETCMNCHSVMWSDSPMLEPVRESFKSDTPLEWNRVYDLPDFVYFDHSIHIKKGIACATCHGRVDKMPLTHKAKKLHMTFCLDCHREPEKFVRPREHVFDMEWEPEEDQETMGKRLVEEYKIKSLTNCTVCHR